MKVAVTIALSSRLILAIALITPSFAQMKLRDELISRQKPGEPGLADFSYGSVHVADFTRKDGRSDEKRPSPAAKIQDGLLSPDGTMIASLFATKRAREPRTCWEIMRRDGSALRNIQWEGTAVSMSVCCPRLGNLISRPRDK